MAAFKTFVSETELEEKRKQRQEEWEKVRTDDQPLEYPEEKDADSRSLFDKLQSQKDLKQSDFEEQFKFKNMVRGIDEDESKFLDEVADRRMEIETKRWKEENEMLQEMKDYSQRVIPVAEVKDVSVPKPQTSDGTGMGNSLASTRRKTQASLLAGVVKRKRSSLDDQDGNKKPKGDTSSPSQLETLPDPTNHPDSSTPLAVGDESRDRPATNANDKARVVTILPGFGLYTNSSDSESSSSDSEIDLLKTSNRSSKNKHS